MKHFFLLLFSIFFLLNCSSQNRYNTWYFGDHAGIDFNTNPPTALGNSAMNQIEGCSGICDNNGQLLFYTDGVTIWNRNHQPMPNGTGLMGYISSTQSALIIPQPQSPNLYYVFTVPSFSFNSSAYSIVDMNLDAGLGDVTATKNVTLHMPVMEKLTATLKSNGIDYWIITKEFGTDAFYIYSLTPAGLDPNPIINHIGYVASNLNDILGWSRISPDGSKYCIAYEDMGLAQLFDFDNSTGLLSNPIDIVTGPPNNYNGPYGVEFSPDNSKLYLMQEITGRLTQYNLLAGSATAIQNSVIQIAILGSGLGQEGGALVRGPDDKIYVCNYQVDHLSVINQPNLTGTACGYDFQGIQLAPGTQTFLGLPNTINFPHASACPPALNLSSNAAICADQTYQLPWGPVVSISGTYSDTIKNVAGSCDSIIRVINLSVQAISLLGTNVHICPNQTYQLPSGVIVNIEGIYPDTLRNMAGCDSVINTIHLFIDHVTLQNTEVHICPGQTYQLPSGIIVSTEGIYADTLRSQASCDSIINAIHLFVDHTTLQNIQAHICSGQTYSLPSGIIVSTSGVYIDTLRSQASCDSIINTIDLTVNDQSYSSHTDSIYLGQTYTLPSGTAISDAGVYQSILVNSFGCDSIITTTLILRKTIAECITLKNAITPNGDGINDYWVLYKYNCFKRLEVSVYNRYGSLVYHSDDYKNDWSGKYKNKELPDGTYYYILNVIAFDGKEHGFRDNVTILR